MQTTAIIVWVYGTLVLAGGVMGYVKAKSLPSLLSGIVCGTLLDMCGVAIWMDKRVGLTTALGIALALLVLMGTRFVKSKKFMPAGLVAVLSGAMVVVLVAALR